MFFNRLGELRDRTCENQQHRASGLNLVIGAIALWNTVYLERAIRALQERSYVFDQHLLAHLSPLKWEHINLTGDYHWRRDGGLRNRKLRPLRRQPLPDFATRPTASGRNVICRECCEPRYEPDHAATHALVHSLAEDASS